MRTPEPLRPDAVMGRKGERGAMFAALLVAIVFGAGYLLFAGTMSTDEIVAAVICAILAMLFSITLRRSGARRYRFRGVPWLRVIGRPLAALLPDAFRV